MCNAFVCVCVRAQEVLCVWSSVEARMKEKKASVLTFELQVSECERQRVNKVMMSLTRLDTGPLMWFPW